MRTVCKLALVIVAVPLLLGADVYRWVDEDGVVNYAQRKPEGVESARMRADTGQRVAVHTTAPAAAPTTSSVTPPTATPNLEVAESGLPSPQELARQRADLCQTARSLLDQLTSRGRVRVRDEDGSARMLTEQERQERIGHAELSIANHCVDTASR